MIAYSYVRLSSKEQLKGHGLERQTNDRTERVCRDNEWALSSDTFRDLGVSAFKGKNALVGNLGEFLKAVASGAINPPCVLIVESFDRISRQGSDEGYDLVKKILKSGVLIQTLEPRRLFDVSATKSLSKGSFEIQMILDRAAEESETKSARVGAAWQKKKAEAGNGGILTTSLPGWVEIQGGKLIVRPKVQATLKQIFVLSAQGFGQKRITQTLIAKKVPPLRRSKAWSASYIGAILRDRRVLGEYQPSIKATGEKDGDPKMYYPRVITEEEWNASRFTANERWNESSFMPTKGGNETDAVNNLFTHLLKDAWDGGNMVVTSRNDEGGKRTILVNASGLEGRKKCTSFPLPVFERAILSQLSEIKVKEILGQADQPDEAQVLAGELAVVRQAIALLEKDLDQHGDSPALFKRLRAKEAVAKEIEAKLQAAQHKEQHPVSKSWKESKHLIEALADAPDKTEARLRLKASLRRVIDRIDVLIIKRGSDRLALVSMFFKGGAEREYVIWHRPPRNNGKTARVEGWFKVRSIRHDDKTHHHGMRLALPGDLTGDPDRQDIEPEATESYFQSLTEEQLHKLVFRSCQAQDL
jgi:DNA invertase Pin-like site-specific DNA recombinase